MTTVIQGQTFEVLFALRDVLSPGLPLLNAFPGGVIPVGAIQVVKPGVAIANSAGTVFENGVGWYTYNGTAGESDLGLSPGEVSELGIHVNLAAAVGHQSFTVQVSSVSAGALTAAERTSVGAAVDTALADNFAALPTASGLDAVLADNFAAIPAAVRDVAVDDDRTLGQAAAIAAGAHANKGSVPTTAAGGPVIIRNKADNANLFSGAIDATGAKTVTP